MHEVLRGERLGERFANLTQLLKAGEIFWRTHAFQMRRLPWESEFPQLSRYLRELSFERAENIAGDNKALIEFLSEQVSAPFSAIENLCAVARFSHRPLPDVEPRDIPGRKWQQIRHFAGCIPANDFSVVEWCAGKSHLGRSFAQYCGCAVTALDNDADLIAAGKRLSARERTRIDFHRVDVMSKAAASFIHRQQNAVALHACGDLHARLLQCCATNNAATITLAPCCYHLTQDAAHSVLSNAARDVELHLTRDDLRTAVHGTVTAPPRETRGRRQLQAWRLAFDILQRDIRGCDEYLPTPSVSLNVLAHGFAAFCRRLADLKRIDLPSVIDYARYERAGFLRLQEVTALSLPRIAFRRALELWLVLDRALFLREQRYDIEVGEFCDRALTSRNLLIRAVAPFDR